MRDVLEKCGVPQPNRADFIHCPFHKGDLDPSMKIYPKDFHCFGCGANGDVIDFVQRFYGMSFKDAFQYLGGTYEKPAFSSKLAIYRAEKAKEMRRKKARELQKHRELNYVLISVYRRYFRQSEPFTDVWCDCYNKLQYQLYIMDVLDKEGLN